MRMTDEKKRMSKKKRKERTQREMNSKKLGK